MADERPLVRHLVGTAGALTEGWLDAQITNQLRYRGDAWAWSEPQASYHWRSTPVQFRARHPVAHVIGRARASERSRVSVFGRRFTGLLRVPLHERADVLHAHYGPIAWTWLGLLPREHVPPLVVSFYGFDASRQRFKQPPWDRRYRELAGRAAAVLVEGPHMAERVTGLGFDATTVHVVRLPFFNGDVPSTDGHADREFDVIMAGRFVAKKGFDDGIRAFAAATPRGRLLLVGDGPDRESLRALAAELGVAQRITWQPPVPLADLADLIARSRVAVFPSRTAPDGDGEGGAPLTLTLAQHLGTPVIASRHDDLPFACAPGTPTFDPGDVSTFADLLQGVLDGTVTTPDARSFVAEVHDETTLTEERERVYDLVR